MAANWQGQAAQAQYPYQPATGYQQPQAGYPQHPCYNAAAYQQYYAQYYGTHQIQQQQAWQQGQYTQYHLQQTWPNGQYSQQYQAPQVSSVPPQVFKHVSQHIIQQPIRQPLSTHNTTHPPSATSLNNQKAISCYNCGAHDHWGAACSQPTRSLMRYHFPFQLNHCS